MEKCHFCKREFETKGGLLTHASRKHKINHLDYKVLTEYNGEWPTCKCGCGEKVNWSGELKSFCEYKQGHISRVNNNWGHNKKAIENSSNTRREQYNSGERKVWNNGKSYEELKGKDWSDKFKKDLSENEDRSKKISKSLTGKKKSPEHIAKITKDRKEYWGQQKHRDEQRARRVKWFQENNIMKPTGLEKTFKQLLENLQIEYHFQYNVENYLYDFNIKDTKILIEVDGDFYHCNPKNHPEPIYEIQKHTVEHDATKNKIAKDNGYKLLRFWEYDVNNHPAKVVKTLLNEIKT